MLKDALIGAAGGLFFFCLFASTWAILLVISFR